MNPNSIQNSEWRRTESTVGYKQLKCTVQVFSLVIALFFDSLLFILKLIMKPNQRFLLLISSIVFVTILWIYNLHPYIYMMENHEVKCNTAMKSSEPKLFNCGIKNFRFHVYNLSNSLVKEMWNHSDPWFDLQGMESHHILEYYLSKLLPLHPCHTNNRNEATVFFVPAQVSIAFLREIYYPGKFHPVETSYVDEVYKWIEQQPEAKRYKGMDHFTTQSILYTFFHPQMNEITKYLPNINLISPEMFDGYLTKTLTISYPETTFNLTKETNFNTIKPNLCMFFGSMAGGSIRYKIKEIMDKRHKEKNDCPFYALSDRSKLDGMYEKTVSAKFGLFARGDSLSARRSTSYMFAGVIPVIICDHCILPLENLINYDEFCIFIREEKLNDPEFDLIGLLESYTEDQIKEMRAKMKKVLIHLTFHQNSIIPGDAIDTTVYQMSLFDAQMKTYRRIL